MSALIPTLEAETYLQKLRSKNIGIIGVRIDAPVQTIKSHEGSRLWEASRQPENGDLQACPRGLQTKLFGFELRNVINVLGSGLESLLLSYDQGRVNLPFESSKCLPPFSSCGAFDFVSCCSYSSP